MYSPVKYLLLYRMSLMQVSHPLYLLLYSLLLLSSYRSLLRLL